MREQFLKDRIKMLISMMQQAIVAHQNGSDMVTIFKMFQHTIDSYHKDATLK